MHIRTLARAYCIYVRMYTRTHTRMYMRDTYIYVTAHRRTCAQWRWRLAELTAILNYLMAGNRKAVRE